MESSLHPPRPRRLTRAFRRKIRQDTAANQKKRVEFVRLQMNLLSSQLMLLKELLTVVLLMLVVLKCRRLWRSIFR